MGRKPGKKASRLTKYPYQINIKVDAQTRNLWKKATKVRNMSEWFRSRLEFDFSNQLPLTEMKRSLMEQSKILSDEKFSRIKRLKFEYELRIDEINQQIRNIENCMEGLDSDDRIRVPIQTN